LHPTAEPELEALAVDPLTSGNGEAFASFVHNGETMVCVRAATDEQMEFAADTLRPSTPRLRLMSWLSPQDHNLGKRTEPEIISRWGTQEQQNQ
jgi:hypothetical protein